MIKVSLAKTTLIRLKSSPTGEKQTTITPWRWGRLMLLARSVPDWSEGASIAN